MARKRILIVDVNEDAAEMLGEVLRMRGFEVVVAHDPAQAPQVFPALRLEIAILDIGPPVMSGYELAERMIATGVLGRLFIAVTGYGQGRRPAVHGGRRLRCPPRQAREDRRAPRGDRRDNPRRAGNSRPRSRVGQGDAGPAPRALAPARRVWRRARRVRRPACGAPRRRRCAAPPPGRCSPRPRGRARTATCSARSPAPRTPTAPAGATPRARPWPAPGPSCGARPRRGSRRGGRRAASPPRRPPRSGPPRTSGSPARPRRPSPGSGRSPRGSTPAGLAELARAEAASGDAAAASRALEQAAARAEQQRGERGRWRWQRGGAEPTVRLLFTPDGARLASADREGTIRIWDVAGGHELRKLELGRWPNSFAISPNGRWLAAAGGNGPLQVWSVASGKRVLELPFKRRRRSRPTAPSSRGRLANAVELAIPSGQELGRFGAASPSALAVGEHIYTSYETDAHQRVLTTWERGREHRQLGEAVLPAGVWELQRAASGELVMSFGDKLAIADERGQARLTLGAYQSLALTPDGRHLLAGPARGGADVIELASGKVLRHLDLAGERPALAVHPRGGLIAAAAGAQIALARLDTGALVARLGAPTPRLAVAFDPPAIGSRSAPTPT